jgi:hypothetical protein
LQIDFQIAFTPKAFKSQQESWKALIQLNLVRSILVICETLVEDTSDYDLDVDSFLSLDPSSSPGYSVREANSLLEASEGNKRYSGPYPG